MVITRTTQVLLVTKLRKGAEITITASLAGRNQARQTSTLVIDGRKEVTSRQGLNGFGELRQDVANVLRKAAAGSPALASDEDHLPEDRTRIQRMRFAGPTS